MASRLPTPPPCPLAPHLVLCADGGGSKVCVVIRSSDGVEARGAAGPCNVQSVGHSAAAQALLLATYRALSLLPSSHTPPDLVIPSSAAFRPSLFPAQPPCSSLHHSEKCALSKQSTEAGAAFRPMRLPALNVQVFRYAWLGLAGINCETDAKGFIAHAASALNVSEHNLKLSNDVNLLAAPALDLPSIDHVVAMVAGTGTVGRTIKKSTLPLEDVAIARGWGYLLCDEGSAFWMGRLAIRNILALADRQASSAIYSGPPPALLPLHRDLLDYFGTSDPADLITLASLAGPSSEGLDAGEATSRRNAKIAGAARVVFRWAFPDDGLIGIGGLPTPPGSSDGRDQDPDTDTEAESDLEPEGSIDVSVSSSAVSEVPKHQRMDFTTPQAQASQAEALRLARRSVIPLIELTSSLLGDQTVVHPYRTALALGGGLMMSKGYRALLLDGLKKEGVVFRRVLVIADAAGEGARAMGKVEFGQGVVTGQ
ncbi:hypothetical protein I316_00775 [Kwoniella heveanensis BCC8398]|uniref:N-acetyl-D-glucosamine kinase n=1 Tax=Kwoniella heveanensis BCC8398 TaxID=1296120 RepID=A0A1B9H305_9TREE|nr:hypothetical protein I316_00775 [Kwoniella heveanensis BCC8398]